LSRRTGISARKISAYQRGERAIPLPELDSLASELGHEIQDYVDTQGPVGKWREQQQMLRLFADLSPALRAFLREPSNIPYLRIAKQLSDTPASELRALGEKLLGLTP
jgi:hypothetical protein